jgi:DNA-binding response OmpR family regulator
LEINLSIHAKQQSLRLLIVEDSQNLATVIGNYLTSRGHIPDFALDGIGGLHLALTQQYDAIVLDISLPGMDGLTFCHKLREEGGNSTPILIITGRDTLSDKLKGFKAGADDYLVKPFAMEELEARLKVMARRDENISEPRLQVADLVLNPGTMQVERAGQAIKLSPTDIKILSLLMKAFPNVISRAEMEFALWGDEPPGSDALRSHIYSLRRAIDKPFDTPLLETVHGVGYKLTVPDDALE